MQNHNILQPVKRSKLRRIAGREYYVMRRRLQWLARYQTYAHPIGGVGLEHSIVDHRTMMLRPLKDVEMYLQHNKITNLRLAIAPVNGTVIRPGQTFSVWRLVGRPTAAKGYLDGLVLS
ncbi:MAG: VanW family protein, partial [Pyrinomonadaceae bacterium]